MATYEPEVYSLIKTRYCHCNDEPESFVLNVTENSESENLTEIVKMSTENHHQCKQTASEQKFIFIHFETPKKIKILKQYDINGTLFDYKCHVRHTYSENLYETNFFHKGEFFFDVNREIDYSSNTNKEDHVKMIILSKEPLQKPINETFIYGDNSMNYLRKKWATMNDPEKSKYVFALFS